MPEGLGELAARARADSNDAQLNYQVARAFWAAKNWDEAEHYLREAITVAPQYAEALFALGQLPAGREVLEEVRDDEGAWETSPTRTASRW